MGVLAAMTTRSERIADEIAGVLFGLILAGLLYLAMGWLWREMRLPIVVIFLVFWVFASVDTIMLQQRNLLRTSFSRWIKPSEIGKRRRSLTLTERIWGDIATVLLGAIVGSFLAGLIVKVAEAIGPVCSGCRWLIFVVVFLLWTAITFAGATADRDSVNPGGAVFIGGGASLSLQGGPTTFGIGVGSKGVGVSATWTLQLWPLWGD